MKKEIVIVDGIRTPQAKFGGSLKDITAQKLGETVVRALLDRTKIDINLIDELILGQVFQSTDAANIGRYVSLLAGLPIKITGQTTNRNCASGLQALVAGYQNIFCGDAEIVLAGGTESMSNAPFLSRNIRFGKRLGNVELVDAITECFTDPIYNQLMGRTAENLAEEYKISCQEQDQFALRSHRMAVKAVKEGKFKDEITPVNSFKKVNGKETVSQVLREDEGPNPNLTEKILAAYPPVFKENGTVTAGNSCSISDGAAIVLMMTAEKAKELGYEPLGYIRTYVFVGVEPQRMGIGPACAVPLVLKKAAIEWNDIQLVEINETFAAQILACERELAKRGIRLDWEKTNVNGGAIAFGHPVGATGARFVITLLNEMKRRDLMFGLAALCIGGGQGGAIIIERK